MRAPQGCTQWFYGSNSQTVRSYNFNAGAGIHLGTAVLLLTNDSQFRKPINWFSIFVCSNIYSITISANQNQNVCVRYEVNFKMKESSSIKITSIIGKLI